MNKRNDDTKDLIDTFTTAMILNVTPRTVRNHAATGLLKKFRIGRRIYYEKRQVRELLFNNIETGE